MKLKIPMKQIKYSIYRNDKKEIMTSITKIKSDEVKREKNIRSILTDTKIKSSSSV